jgi:hypothetical protein
VNRLRAQLREPQRRALVLLGDLQATGGVTPAGKVRARALTLEVEAMSRVIDQAEIAQMPLMGAPPVGLRASGARPAPMGRSAQ